MTVLRLSPCRNCGRRVCEIAGIQLHCEALRSCAAESRLTAMPLRFARLMLCRLGHYVPRECIMDALWPDPDRMPEVWVISIRVQAMHVRRAFRAFGIALKAQWGGYIASMECPS